MSVQLNQWINAFSSSEEYQTLPNLPLAYVTEVLQAEATTMHELYAAELHELTKEQLTDFLMLMREQADADSEPDAEQFFEETYVITRTFWQFLANNQLLAVSTIQMAELLAAFELVASVGEWAQPVIDSTPVSVNTDPTLPEWREYVAEDIKCYVQLWLTVYLNSAKWRKGRHLIDEATLELAVTSLADLMYDWHRKTPKTWTKKGLRDVMTHYWVTNVDFELEDYPKLVPAISQWLDFVGQKGWLNAQKVANYKRYMQAIEPEMLEQTQDESQFGPAKLIFRQLRAAGIDPEDQAAVDQFIDELNQRGGMDALTEAPSEPDDELEDVREALNNPETLRQLAELYDPDPTQQYLEAPHLPVNGARTWKKKTAITVHAQAVQFGMRLWFTAKPVIMAQGYDAPMTLALVCEFVDVMYAQHVQKPSEWTVPAWREFSEWLHKGSLQDQRGLRQGIILAQLATVLGDAEIIESGHAEQLAAAMRGEASASQQTEAKRVKGKKRSNKQVRKLLKHRR